MHTGDDDRIDPGKAFRALSWAACALLYLVLAGQLSPTEGVTAIAVAALSGSWSASVRRCSRCRFSPDREHLLSWARAIAGLPAASWRAGCRLARVAVLGAAAPPLPAGPLSTRHRFDQGRIDDPAGRARRATALLTASLAPPSFVARLPTGRAEVLVHRLCPARREPDRRWLHE